MILDWLGGFGGPNTFDIWPERDSGTLRPTVYDTFETMADAFNVLDITGRGRVLKRVKCNFTKNDLQTRAWWTRGIGEQTTRLISCVLYFKMRGPFWNCNYVTAEIAKNCYYTELEISN